MLLNNIYKFPIKTKATVTDIIRCFWVITPGEDFKTVHGFALEFFFKKIQGLIQQLIDYVYKKYYFSRYSNKCLY